MYFQKCLIITNIFFIFCLIFIGNSKEVHDNFHYHNHLNHHHHHSYHHHSYHHHFHRHRHYQLHFHQYQQRHITVTFVSSLFHKEHRRFHHYCNHNVSAIYYSQCILLQHRNGAIHYAITHCTLPPMKTLQMLIDGGADVNLEDDVSILMYFKISKDIPYASKIYL